jgi:SAM-dependent methyltransferase
VLSEWYLSRPDDPYRQSGRSRGAERWEQTRRCIADAIHRDGDFMDVGCANGLLLETLIGWAAERGHAIRPYGIDFIPELVELARRRHPRAARDAFDVANAFYWRPGRQYDWVRTNLEYVQERDWPEFLQRQYELAVVEGGRLIVCAYGSNREPARDVATIVEKLGYRPAGSSGAPGVSLAWIDKTE